jgi:hypothetical protein
VEKKMRLQRSIMNIDVAPDNLVALRSSWHMIGELELVPIVTHHARLHALCERLEKLADGLPAISASPLVDELCAELTALTCPLTHGEVRLFDGLFARATPEPLRTILLERIKRQHLAEAIAAEDLAAVLRPLIPGTRAFSADALGYMLRSFFEAVRANIAFETLALLALGGNRLTKEAGALLLDRLSGCGSRTQPL